jgi:uncharacterized Rossmann fold enzyme
MEKIIDKHKGKRIWVCGSGGSLLDVIPSKIPKEDIVIACNSATYHFNRFNYAVFTDETANYSNWYLDLKKKRCNVILLNRGIKVIKQHTLRIDKDFTTWNFKEAEAKGMVIGGYDVIHCAVHLAFIMGASEVILAGVDLKHYTAENKHAHSQELTEDAPQWLKDMIEVNTAANKDLFDGHLGLSLGGWKLINEQQQLNIKSIAVNGNLTIYPLIPFDELCNK